MARSDDRLAVAVVWALECWKVGLGSTDRVDLTPQMIQVWQRALSAARVKDFELRAVVDVVMGKSQFFPTPKAVIDSVVEWRKVNTQTHELERLREDQALPEPERPKIDPALVAYHRKRKADMEAKLGNLEDIMRNRGRK